MNKTNPRRIPRTQADVEKAERTAVINTAAIFLTVLSDKGWHTPEELSEIWKQAESLAEGIKKGYVKTQDLIDTLRAEYEIALT